MGSTVYDRQPAPREVIEHSLKGSKLGSFWLDGVDRTNFPKLTETLEADIVIVGGGYLGLWTAIRAKERAPRKKVVLLEAERVGHAASGRNGGFCEASITHGLENGTERWPEEIEQLVELGKKNLQEFEETLKRYHIDCDFERNGGLMVATEPYQVVDYPGVLNAQEVQAEVNSPAFLAGYWDKTGTALLHPGKLAMGLARAATGLGVLIFEHSPVKRLKSLCPTVVDVQLADCSVRARSVVLATNAYPSLLGKHRARAIPVYDYVLVSEQLTPEQLDSIGWKNRQGISDGGNQFHYFRLTKDNRILFGGWDAIYNFGGKVDDGYEDRTESYETLASHLFTLFPQLAGLKFTHRWGGAIDTSTRFCAFYAKAMDGRVHYAAGFTGLGVGATRFAANVLLDRCLGESTERTRLRMVREVPMAFPPEPFRWIGIRLTQWSLKQADRNGGRRNLYLRTLDALGLGFDS